MGKRPTLTPYGIELVRSSIFLWLVYTASTVVFTFVATSLSTANIPTFWVFTTALVVSCIFLIGAYSGYSLFFHYPVKRGRQKQSESHLSKEVLELAEAAASLAATLEVFEKALDAVAATQNRNMALILEMQELREKTRMNWSKLQAILRRRHNQDT